MLDPNVILNHDLVPKHEKLTKKDAKELMEKYGVTNDQLPKIREADPVVEAISAKKGDVLKITRKSITAGEAVYYRVVV